MNKNTTAKEKNKFSGSERVCRKNVFSDKQGVIRNNCYAWSIGAASANGPSYKLQPGDLSTRKPFRLSKCGDVIERTKEDLGVIGGYVSPFQSVCKKNHYKIALILAPGMDYHFLVHHKDVVFKITCSGETRTSIAKKFNVPVKCVEKAASYKRGDSVYIKNADCWSHKRGTAYPVSLMDSNGKIIKDPRKATFDYGMLNYTIFCATFCVKRRPDMNATVVKSDNAGNLRVHAYDAQPMGIKKVINRLKKRMGISNTQNKKNVKH